MSEDIDLAGINALSNLKIHNIMYNRCIRNFAKACNQEDPNKVSNILTLLEPVLRDGFTDGDLEENLDDIEKNIPRKACVETIAPVEVDYNGVIIVAGEYIFDNGPTKWKWPTKDLIPDILEKDLKEIDPVLLENLKKSKKFWVDEKVDQSYKEWTKNWVEESYPDWKEDKNVTGVCKMVVDGHLLQAAAIVNGSLEEKFMKDMTNEDNRKKLMERCVSKFRRYCVKDNSFYAYKGIKNFVQRIDEKMGLDEIDVAMVELNASVHYNLRMDTDVISAPEDCEKHATGLLGTVFSVYGQRNSAPVFGSNKME